MLGPANPQTLPAATGPIVGGRLLVMGFAIRETSGAASATVRLRDGVALGTSMVFAPIQLAPAESVRDWFGPGGIVVNSGLFAEIASGAVEGSVFVITEADVDPVSWAAFMAGQIFGGESLAGGIRP